MCMHIKHDYGLQLVNRLLCNCFRSVCRRGTWPTGKSEEYIDNMRGSSEQVNSYKN